LSKRDFWSNATSFIANAANNAINTVTQDVQAAEKQANATIQAALGNVTEAVNGGIAAAYAALVQINNTAQEITNTAIAVVKNASQELAALQDKAKADITNFLNMLKKYGNGSLNCVQNYNETIRTVIGTAGKF
jgi:phage-related protein